MVKSNVNIDNLGLGLKNGTASLELGIFDYPKLTIVTSDSNLFGGIGTVINCAGYVLYLDGINIELPPVNPGNYVPVTTYTFTHLSKKVYEFPVNSKDFVDANKGSALVETDDEYMFSIGSLVGFAGGKAGGGGVAPPYFTFNLSKKPGPGDYITIKQFCDERVRGLGYVYSFSGATLGFAPPGASRGNGYPVTNYTIGQNSVAVYKDTILEWDKKQQYPDGSTAKAQYIQLTNDEYALYDGDYNPHIEPSEALNGRIPSDLSIMIDNSGPSKQFKITKYKYGKPDKEISGVFGYAHAAIELVDDPQKPNNSSELVLSLMKPDVVTSKSAYDSVLKQLKTGKFGYPDDANFSRPMVWRLISLKEVTYEYTPLQMNPEIYLKKPDGTKVAVKIDDASMERLTRNNYQVLTGETTRGWEIKRFAQEDPANWTQGSIAAWLNLKTLQSTEAKILGNNPTKKAKQLYYWMLYQAKVNLEQYLYRKIPIFETTKYAVDMFSKYYIDSEDIDWKIEMVPKSSIKGEIVNDGELIPIIYPDPNWMPDLMITSRARYKSSVAESGNPNYNPFARDYYGSNPRTVVSGSEEYEYTKYTILPSKNTKPFIGAMYNRFSNLATITSGANATKNLTGTVYANAQDYLYSNDTGLNGATPPNIDLSSVLVEYPSQPNRQEDMYSITTTSRTAQDHSFKSNITSAVYTLSEGRPPAATLRKALFEEVKTSDNTDNPLANSVTYVTSGITGLEVQSSVNISGVNNLQEATQAAGNLLMLDILSNGTTASATLSFTQAYPSLINSGISLAGGTWVIKRGTVSCHYSQGTALAQPIQVECGMVIQPGISARTVAITNENNKSADSMTAAVSFSNLPEVFTVLPDIIPDTFGRWVKSSS